MRRWLSSALGERGNVLAMVIFMLTTMLAFSGVAVDIGRVISVKAELQRAVDAGALAGAAKLGFNSTPFPVARTAAVNWANKNPWSGGPTNLDPNSNVQFGVWGSGTWTDWDGTEIGTNGAIYVNAVRCSGWSATVPTLFLGLIGKPTISVSALSTAVSNPPSAPPPGAPVAPFALPMCKFSNNGSSGCGALVAIDTNGWVDLTGNGNSNQIDGQLVNAANGAPAPASLQQPTPVTLGATGGTLQSVFNDLASYTSGDDKGQPGKYGWKEKNTDPYGQIFKRKWESKTDTDNPHPYSDSGTIYNVVDKDNALKYNGRGWSVYAGLSKCDGSGNPTGVVVTWLKFVIVQVITNDGYCAVNLPNPAGITDSNLLWRGQCLTNAHGFNGPNGGVEFSGDSPTKVASNRIYGYIDCSALATTVYTGPPIPRVAIGTKVRLVQ